jgi:hypothetical protein
LGISAILDFKAQKSVRNDKICFLDKQERRWRKYFQSNDKKILENTLSNILNIPKTHCATEAIIKVGLHFNCSFLKMYDTMWSNVEQQPEQIIMSEKHKKNQEKLHKKPG